MMRERDESGDIIESSLAFEEVMWVLQQMLQVLRRRVEEKEEGEEGDGDDPNTRPKKRCVASCLIHVELSTDTNNKELAVPSNPLSPMTN
jgi:hypothetical protein